MTNEKETKLKKRLAERIEHVMKRYSVAKTLLNDAKLRDHWDGIMAALDGRKIKFLEGYTAELGGYAGELKFLQELLEIMEEDDL